MRERDRWWAFFRGDIDWGSVSSSQFHGKKAVANDNRRRETVEYDEELPQQKGKMRGWVVYEEKLSWDQAEGEGVAALSYGGGEEGVDDGGVSDAELHASKGEGKDVTAHNALPTPRGSLSPLTAVSAAAAIQDGPKPREPTPELLSLLDQKVTFHLLKYFTQWIQGHFDRSFLPAPPPASGANSHSYQKQLYDLTPTHARWMFALLARLDAQLTSDEISVLRKLAREIMRVINEERLARKAVPQSPNTKSSMSETACWMIVAAVTGVWGQKDLWIDAENALW